MGVKVEYDRVGWVFPEQVSVWVFERFKGEKVLAELLNCWLVERGNVSWTSLAIT
jgi:hypothetical protein